MEEKHQFFNGLCFTRDDKTGYYQCSTIHDRMHRIVWEHHNGEIPEGFHVHHIDGDKSNNKIENLETVPAGEHSSMHMTERVAENPQSFIDRMNYARIKASEWHGSEAGREWHKKHYKGMKESLHVKKEFVCKHCGKAFMSIREGFCTNACKSAWRRSQGYDNETRNCKHCGKEFVVNKYAKTEYCSQSCVNTHRSNTPLWKAKHLQHGSKAAS